MVPKKDKKHERVFFVGAGLSVGMGYPTGRELMRRLVDYLQGRRATSPPLVDFSNTLHESKHNRRLAKNFLDAIKDVTEKYFSVSLDRIKDIDVAEFFTVAQALTETPALFETGTGVPTESLDPTRAFLRSTLFDVLAAATRTFFYDISRSVYVRDVAPDVASLLGKLRPQSDAIVNFNWDEEVEVFCTEDRDLDVAYNLPHWQSHGDILVLKPHGSIGWYDVRQAIGNKGAYFIAEDDPRVQPVERRIVSFYELELPKSIDRENEHPTLACPPMITAPTFAKRFAFHEQQCVWRDVLQVCREAREFVFLGYSLPPDDFLTRAAIRSALQHREPDELRCLIVSLAADPIGNFQSLFQDALSMDRNFLPWRFGNGDEDLPKQLAAKLKRATLNR